MFRPSTARSALGALVAMTAFALTSCRRVDELPSQAEATPATTSTASAHAGVKVLHAKPGKVEDVVREARQEAAAEGRSLVVYVGATWCEPCRYFHEAAAKGELDESFPKLTLLEFDLDANRGRLERGGYVSNFVPLFVVPDAEGRATSKRFEGSVKGPRAVAYITPKLRTILEN